VTLDVNEENRDDDESENKYDFGSDPSIDSAI
jgi:hypothetical protein